MTGNERGVDRARRRPGEDGNVKIRMMPGDSAKDAGLIGGARTAAAEDERRRPAAGLLKWRLFGVISGGHDPSRSVRDNAAAPDTVRDGAALRDVGGAPRDRCRGFTDRRSRGHPTDTISAQREIRS